MEHLQIHFFFGATMKIDISSITHHLQSIEDVIGNLEYSGFGWVIKIGDTLTAYDFELLHVGSEAFTDIQPAKIIPLIDRPDNKNMKLWVHRHPMGNGIPGPHNWSYIDHKTCTKTPMGGIPELIGWSAAVVHTLGGWVGRIDNHTKKKTVHVPVEIFDYDAAWDQAIALRKEYKGCLTTRDWDGYEFKPLETEGKLVQAELFQAEKEQKSIFDWIRSLL